MSKLIKIFLSALIALNLLLTPAVHAGWGVGDIKRGAGQVYDSTVGKGSLSNEEVIRGLKEALTIGAKNAASNASKMNGYYLNKLIKIPFPPEANKVKDAAIKLGLNSQVEDFVKTLNHAAEEAAKEAAPIFVDAIKSLTVKDGFEILKGPDNAATKYLQGKTTQSLKNKFKPVVTRATNKVQLTKYWNPVASGYNSLPFVQKVNPDLNEYVTNQAIKGLFTLIAGEERKIRKDPSARVTDLLRKVFGS